MPFKNENELTFYPFLSKDWLLAMDAMQGKQNKNGFGAGKKSGLGREEQHWQSTMKWIYQRCAGLFDHNTMLIPTIVKARGNGY